MAAIVSLPLALTAISACRRETVAAPPMMQSAARPITPDVTWRVRAGAIGGGHRR
jgi:hypothetical protein